MYVLKALWGIEKIFLTNIFIFCMFCFLPQNHENVGSTDKRVNKYLPQICLRLYRIQNEENGLVKVSHLEMDLKKPTIQYLA